MAHYIKPKGKVWLNNANQNVRCDTPTVKSKAIDNPQMFGVKCRL